jgi:siroheme synthase-like protein
MRLNTNRKRSARKKSDTNRLFPVFVKLEELNVLIVGGGKVAVEKLAAILNNCPSTPIRIVSKSFLASLRKLSRSNNVKLIKREFDPGDLDGADIVFSAVNDVRTSKLIAAAARRKGILHNAADKPGLCDFYLGSIVQKGNLKIGISTNGKSPTLAKRLKKILEQTIPDSIDETLANLAAIRSSLAGDMKSKVERLNAITSIFISEPPKTGKRKGTKEEK